MNLRTGLMVFVVTIVVVAGATANQHGVSRPTSSHRWSSSDRKGHDFALVTASGSTYAWGTWNSFDLQKIGGKGDRLIVKRDGKTYVITDSKLVGEAIKAIEPVNVLGRKQGELGKQQGALGRKQGELGRQQGELGREQGRLGRNEAQLVGSETSQERLKKWAARQKEASSQMRALGEKQRALGQKQRVLGDQQRALGDKQKELGNQQRVASEKADKAINSLVDLAFRKGLAKQIK